MTIKSHCTFSPDGLFGYNWGECCKQHDTEYRKKVKTKTRKETDLLLFNCMKSKLPNWLIFLPYIYYYMVRLLCIPSWERWNYKWYLGVIPIKVK